MLARSIPDRRTWPAPVSARASVASPPAIAFEIIAAPTSSPESFFTLFSP